MTSSECYKMLYDCFCVIVTGSILNFAASKLRGDQSLKHSISEETADEYESLNRQVRNNCLLSLFW